MNRLIFREYDIRGIAGTEMNSDLAFLLGRGFGTMARRAGKNRVAIGGDNRVSTPEIKDRMIEGLCAAGCAVTDVGEVPSPVLYYALYRLDMDTGMMVTASHNPPEYNGVKMVLGHASLYGKAIQNLADIIERSDFTAGSGTRETRSVKEEYLAELKGKFSFRRKLRIGLDCGNGTAGSFIVPLLEALGCEVHGIFIESDGRFPNHLPDPTVEKNMKDLMVLVKAGGLEAGLGLDGDGDRFGVVDDRGRMLLGDRLLILYAREILAKRPGAAVIFDVKCTKALAEEVAGAGGEPVMWKTGHSLIESKLHEMHAPLAGELSGHLYFADEYDGYDDGIYAALRLLRILDATPRPLSTLLAGVKEYPSTPEMRIDVADERKFGIVDGLRDYYRPRYAISEIDGAKVFFPDGWALVRASNTQPALVVRVEAENEEALHRIKDEFLAKVDEFKRQAEG